MKYYLSTDVSSYGNATDGQIEWIRGEERRICAERRIVVIECHPMARPAYGADDFHPDSEQIFLQAICACPEL